MSSSCNPAPATPKPEIHSFLYGEVVAQAGTVTSHKAAPAIAAAGEGISITNEVLAQREAAAREAGRQEGEAQARMAGEQQLAQIRESVASALTGFARDRAQYYQRVESEVVQLALSIAGKILHREAQLDPLLLAGLVRVTLEKIESTTKVVVRVHPEQVSDWRGYFAHHMEASQVPDVVEDPALPSDHCLLQTALGTTDLGVGIQLKEIEQGLFDLLAKRPTGI
jgi:flagellar assembly protein FliH